MAGRLSSLFARGRGAEQRPPAREAESSPDAAPGSRPLERVPHPVTLRRERRALMRKREEAIRDVGGLAVEMYRRDRFREDLLLERSADVIRIEERIHELDSLLASAAAASPSLRGAARCECGAPLPRGAHFCSHCGRPARGTRPVATCSHCGQPLPADANFCPSCGNAAAADDLRREEAADREREDREREDHEPEPFEATIVRPSPRPDDRAGDT